MVAECAQLVGLLHPNLIWRKVRKIVISMRLIIPYTISRYKVAIIASQWTLLTA